jgi:toxin-antitoxin system PIN domain toxin
MVEETGAAKVILVDANVLIYAIDEDAPHHRPARDWVEQAFAGVEPIGVPWIVLLAFLRLVTRPAIMRKPLSPEAALAFVDEWLALPAVHAVSPGPGHWPIVRTLLASAGTAGNLTTDAHIAALALELAAPICTADRDFQRFPGVRIVGPFA